MVQEVKKHSKTNVNVVVVVIDRGLVLLLHFKGFSKRNALVTRFGKIFPPVIFCKVFGYILKRLFNYLNNYLVKFVQLGPFSFK